MRGLEKLSALNPSAGECTSYSESFFGRLKEEKKQLEKRLKNINEVLSLLEKFPEVANVLEALGRLNY